MTWVALNKFLKCNFGLRRIVEIVFVNFADGEERVKTKLAPRIFLTKKSILFDGGAQDVFVVEGPTHLDQQLGGCDNTGVSFA